MNHAPQGVSGLNAQVGLNTVTPEQPFTNTTQHHTQGSYPQMDTTHTTPAESTLKPWRIGTDYKTRPTDGRSQIIATSRGPVRAARLTHNYDASKSHEANHEAAARNLAVKITGNEAATVTEHSSNDSGTKRDWSVTA